MAPCKSRRRSVQSSRHSALSPVSPKSPFALTFDPRLSRCRLLVGGIANVQPNPISPVFSPHPNSAQRNSSFDNYTVRRHLNTSLSRHTVTTRDNPQGGKKKRIEQTPAKLPNDPSTGCSRLRSSLRSCFCRRRVCATVRWPPNTLHFSGPSRPLLLRRRPVSSIPTIVRMKLHPPQRESRPSSPSPRGASVSSLLSPSLLPPELHWPALPVSFPRTDTSLGISSRPPSFSLPPSF